MEFLTTLKQIPERGQFWPVVKCIVLWISLIATYSASRAILISSLIPSLRRCFYWPWLLGLVTYIAQDSSKHPFQSWLSLSLGNSDITKVIFIHRHHDYLQGHLKRWDSYLSSSWSFIECYFEEITTVKMVFVDFVPSIFFANIVCFKPIVSRFVNNIKDLSTLWRLKSYLHLFLKYLLAISL